MVASQPSYTPTAAPSIRLRLLKWAAIQTSLRASPRDPWKELRSMFKKVANPKSVRFYVRFKPDEKTLLSDQAKRAGLTMSEYVRKRALGMPVRGRDMEKAINELRRLGGLQKLLALQSPTDGKLYQELLRDIVAAIGKLEKEGA